MIVPYVADDLNASLANSAARPRSPGERGGERPLSTSPTTSMSPTALDVADRLGRLCPRSATEPLIRGRRLHAIGQREPDSRASGMRKVPPPAGRATGHTPGVGDGWLWNSNDTPHPDP